MPEWLIGLVILLGSGVIGALVWAVRAVLNGQIAPRLTLEDVRADRDARVAEAREREKLAWEAFYAERHRNAYRDEREAELLELARTTYAIIYAMQQVAGVQRESRAVSRAGEAA